jgi:hypothetical protein
VENIQVNEAAYGVDENQFMPWPRLWREEEADDLTHSEEGGGAEALSAGSSDEIAHEEWAVGSACYMCHSCTNFGVHGKEGRPCAKGLSDLIKRRQKGRLSAQAARRKGV